MDRNAGLRSLASLIMPFQFPAVIPLGQIRISAHVFFELLAFVAGFRYFLYIRKHSGDPVSNENRLWVIVGAAAGALAGSRVLAVFEDISVYQGGVFNTFYQFFSSKTIVGGLLGGLIGVESVKKYIGETESSGDLFVYPLLLAIITGRIGCFLAGLTDRTYGVETTLFTGIDLGDGVRRHPLPLYEILFLSALWIGLFLWKRWKRDGKPLPENGLIFKIFLFSYFLFRFFIDFLKPTPRILGLTAIQTACALGIIYYSVVFAQRIRKK